MVSCIGEVEVQGGTKPPGMVVCVEVVVLGGMGEQCMVFDSGQRPS